MSGQPTQYCPSCRAELRPNSKFCAECGAKIDKNVPTRIDFISKDEIPKLTIKATELFTARKLDEAIPILDNLIAAAPNSDLFLMRGQCDFFKENYYQALHFFERALELKPDGLTCNQMMGLNLFKMNRFSEAAPFLEKALSIEYDSNIETLFKLCKQKGN